MRDVIVLCYHAVSARWRADISVTPARLEEQLRILLDHSYRAATFHEAVTAPPARKTVAVTFDDGFRTVLEHGFGVLSRLGMTGTLFVVTDFVGSPEPMGWAGVDHWLGGAYADELAPISWDELRQLADAGWEIGSHTCTHPYLTRCDDDELERELRRSREQCEERLERPCRSLAYPFGDFDERVVRAAAKAGYAAACTLPERLHEPTRLAWPRVAVWNEDTSLLFRVKVSPPFRRLRSSPAWSALDAVRRSLGAARRVASAGDGD